MESPVECREARAADLDKQFLENFKRTQKVSAVYRGDRGAKQKIATDYVDDWSPIRKREIEKEIRANQAQEGIVLVALAKGELVGFASISPSAKGPGSEYHDLAMLHVDERYRNKGLGKKLFSEALACARRRKIAKLYISSNSAHDTVEFYRSVGCVDARWIDEEQVRNEPCDYQLEYRL